MARSNKSSGSRAVRGASERGMSATQLLRKDHETVQQLLQRIEKTGGAETKQRLFEEIERELETHATIEEEIFYPAVQEEAPGAKDLVQEAMEEHSVVKSLLREIGAMSPDDEQYDPKVKVLKDNVEHHIEEEQNEMFPKAEQLGDERLRQLGAELQARKEALGKPALRRIMSGVSGLIFGNGETAATESEKRAGGAGKSSARARTQANKRAAGGRARARKGAATAKKRKSGRSAEARGAAKKRSSRASASGRRRAGARKTARKR